ncbi:hypothetical protein F4778DRAFT_725669 [Xylariomycetidae sp. FL2044]|nr:hypothetical protein F4778DRAFT_725669 [Xylariomycetidae sp. FL2044]
MKSSDLIPVFAVPALGHDLLSSLSGFDVCNTPSLLASILGGPACAHDNESLKTQFSDSLEESLVPSSWPISTPCTQNGTERFCLFADPSFANGHGISLLTTPERAERIAQSSIFKNSAAHDEIPQLNAQESPRWNVQPVPGKDMGLMATQRLEVGDQIMADTPAIMIDYELYYKLQPSQISALQAEAIMTLPAKHRAAYLNLSTHDQVETYEGRVGKILETNAFDIARAGDVEEDEDAFSWYTVFSHVSRMNHDCRPNADYYFDHETFTHNIHAIRPIMPGEEVTLSYIDMATPRAERQEHIDHSWHFSCTCSQCAATGAAAAASDARVAQIQELRSQLRDYEATSQATPQMGELMVSLYEQERLWGLLYEAYTYAAVEWNGAGEPWAATRYARLAVQHGLAAVGPHNSDVREMRSLARDPWAHWSWMLRTRKRMNWGSRVEA